MSSSPPRVSGAVLGLLLGLWVSLAATGLSLTVSEAEAQDAGRRIWANECGGSVEGLTSWNQGEDFPSLGIGHFIWYPAGRQGPFEESFPRLVAYLQAQGVDLPPWLLQAKACPWRSRQEFLADLQGPRLTSLRQLLSHTVAHQARFAALRLEGALPLMLAQIPASERSAVQARFEAVAAAPGGVYALVDYVNFKGEGIKATERYHGKGWGLLQVLQEMGRGQAPPGKQATAAFAAAAGRVLTERVKNSPPERHESRWLSGWLTRCRSYASP